MTDGRQSSKNPDRDVEPARLVALVSAALPFIFVHGSANRAGADLGNTVMISVNDFDEVQLTNRQVPATESIWDSWIRISNLQSVFGLQQDTESRGAVNSGDRAKSWYLQPARQFLGPAGIGTTTPVR